MERREPTKVDPQRQSERSPTYKMANWARHQRILLTRARAYTLVLTTGELGGQCTVGIAQVGCDLAKLLDANRDVRRGDQPELTI